ncbi:MAG TPA: purine-binding chemotaxis protein CheW [Deltaproteobacteria bacterium]|nr:purine-binding chemotaxis protein CheW [Deltaproteobacteria bacterium]
MAQSTAAAAVLAEDSEQIKQLVSFILGKEEFGVDILMVQEIIRLATITPIPNAPEFIEGVINLRGKVIPISDLRKRLKITKEEVKNAKHTRILVIEIDGNVTGFIVDAVSEVLKIPINRIEPPPEIIVSSIDSEYISGVIKLEENLLILLDFKKILRIDERDKLRKVHQTLPS